MTEFARVLTFAITQFALTPLLTKVVRLSPPMIGFLSASSKVSYYVIVAFASNRTMVRKNIEGKDSGGLRSDCPQAYIACLTCMEGGVGNIVSRWGNIVLKSKTR